jgi:hypothetical protein
LNERCGASAPFALSFESNAETVRERERERERAVELCSYGFNVFDPETGKLTVNCTQNSEE